MTIRGVSECSCCPYLIIVLWDRSPYRQWSPYHLPRARALRDWCMARPQVINLLLYVGRGDLGRCLVPRSSFSCLVPSPTDHRLKTETDHKQAPQYPNSPAPRRRVAAQGRT
eukprot:scaffold31773_cov32-Tisochrysis_lutea.AAC.4